MTTNGVHGRPPRLAVRLVYLSALPLDAELARDVSSGSGSSLPLVRRGTKLTPSIAERLLTRGVSTVWINDELGEGIEPIEPLPPDVRRHSERVLSKSLLTAQVAMASAQALPQMTVEALARVAEDISRALADCPSATLALNDLAGADPYTHGHSLRVATIGLLMAHEVFRHDGWVDWSGKVRRDRCEERMATLGFGLVVHDIGNLTIPGEILNKPAQLDRAEYELIKKHPQAGTDMLAAADLSPLTMAVVRDHHERIDGSGYPNGRSDTLHQFARIAAIAEVYDAIVSDRPYKPGARPHTAVETIRNGAGTQFDERIVEHFCHVVMPYPLGCEAELPDGRTGVVSALDSARPYAPTVRLRDAAGHITEETVDLSPAPDRAAAA